MGKVIDKLISARFLTVFMLIVTTCLLAWKGTFPMEAFAGLVTLCLRDYFQRSDRGVDSKTEIKTTTASGTSV